MTELEPVLAALVARMSRMDPAPSAAGGRLPAELRAAYFALDVDPPHDVESFVCDALVRLTGMLSRRSERRLSEYRGQVRGRVDWAATLKARFGESPDHTRFLCRETHHEVDTPENQLLKVVVEQLRATLLGLPPMVRRGAVIACATGRLERSRRRLDRLETALELARCHTQYRAIATPTRVTPEHLYCAETSRTRAYGQLARLYRRWLAFTEDAAEQAAAEAARRVLVVPDTLDGGGESWVVWAARLSRSAPGAYARERAAGSPSTR